MDLASPAFSEIVDVDRLQRFVDVMYAATAIPIAVLSLDLKVVVSAGRQEICSEFHRKCPETERLCREAHSGIAQFLTRAGSYQCGNGLMSCVSPIEVNGETVGMLLTGQLLHETPDEERYLARAGRYGFDPEGYIRALRKVPVIPADKMPSILSFLSQIATIFADLGLTRLRELDAKDMEIRESRRALETLMSNLPGMAYRCRNDRDWTMEIVSQGCRELTGYEPSDLIGSKTICYADLIAPGHRGRTWNEIQRALECGEHFEVIYDIRTAQGVEKTVWERGRGVRSRDGQVIAIEGFISDITRLSQAEQALGRSEQLYRTLAESSPDGIFLVDRDDVLQYANGVVARRLGFEPETMIGKPRSLAWPADMISRERPVVEDVFEKGRRFSMEEKVTVGGQERWFHTWFVPVCDPEGFVVSAMGIARDITSRRRAEDEARQAREHLERVLDSASAPIVVLDSRLKITRFNRAFQSLVKYEVHEIDGEDIGKFVQETGGNAGRDWFSGTSDEELGVAEIPVRAKSGEIRDVLWSKAPIYSSDEDRVLAIVAQGQDITPRKKGESKLRAAEERYRTLFEQAPYGVVVIDPDTGRHVEFNDNACRQLGYTRYEFSLLRVGDYEVEEAIDRISTCISAIADGGTHSFETLHRAKDGSVRNVTVFAQCIAVSGCKHVYAIYQDMTDLKAAEEKLKRFREALDCADDAILLYDTGSKVFVDANRGATLALGFSHDDIVGMGLSDIMPISDAERLNKSLGTADVVKNGLIVFETMCTRRDGTSYPAEILLSPVRGSQHLVVAAARDISERKRAEKVLKESREQYRTLVENMPAAVYRRCAQHPYRLIHVSEAILSLTGLKASTLMSRPDSGYARFVADEDWTMVSSAIRNAIDNRRPYEIEYRLRQMNGEARWVLDTGRPVADEQDNVVWLDGVILDVTKRKEAEKALAESEERLRRAVVLAPVPMMIRDQYNNVLYISKGWTSLSGYTIEDIPTTQAWADKAYGSRAREILSVINGLVDIEDTVASGEYHINTSSGETRVWDFHTTPLGWLGTQRLVLDIAVDVTDRKKAEDSLRAVLADLERSNRDLESFAYIASHDLQEPLRMVTSYLQLLERRCGTAISEEGREFLNYAVGGAHRMRNLIRGLFAYARVSSNAGPIAPMSSSEALSAALENLSAAISDSCAVVTSGPLPDVMANAAQLTQVMENLIANAIKFCSSGQPKVHVSAEREGDMWVFSVHDNGIGIHRDYHTRIFGMFERLHNAEQYPGTGIGLALCKRAIERHGGSIWVESEPGKGSVFRFTLKAVDQ